MLASMEEGLAYGGLGAVVGELVRLPMTASRRLQLAAEKTGAMGIALRRVVARPKPPITASRRRRQPAGGSASCRQSPYPSPASDAHAGWPKACASKRANVPSLKLEPVMPRAVSVYFRYLATDRIRRTSGDNVPADQPLVAVAKSGAKRFLSAVEPQALKLRLRIGMPASKAQALISNLAMVDADPQDNAAALERLALWALRQYSPIVGVDGIDGLILNTEGADHLRGGELSLVSSFVNSLRARGAHRPCCRRRHQARCPCHRPHAAGRDQPYRSR